MISLPLKRRGVEITHKDGQILVIMAKQPMPVSLNMLAIECEFSLPQLCAYLEVSERHLRRVFEDGIGMGPKEWLRQQRMVAARTLLRHGSSIKEVAIDLGFTTSKMFSRDFMQFHGVRPTDFQRRENQHILQALV